MAGGAAHLADGHVCFANTNYRQNPAQDILITGASFRGAGRVYGPPKDCGVKILH